MAAGVHQPAHEARVLARDVRRAEERQADLSAVRVPEQRQLEPLVLDRGVRVRVVPQHDPRPAGVGIAGRLRNAASGSNGFFQKSSSQDLDLSAPPRGATRARDRPATRSRRARTPPPAAARVRRRGATWRYQWS